MNAYEKAVQKVKEAEKRYPKYCIIQGPRGPKGVTGPTGTTGPQGEKGEKGDSNIISFSGMYSTIGYPILVDDTESDYGLIFNEQSLTNGDFTFNPGDISLDPFEITPGTIEINEPGIYELYLGIDNLSTTIDGEYDFRIIRNGNLVNHTSSVRISMHPNELYHVSRAVISELNENDIISVDVRVFVNNDGQLLLSGGHVELLLKKIGN